MRTGKCIFAEDSIQCGINFKLKNYCNNCKQGHYEYRRIFKTDYTIESLARLREFDKQDKSHLKNKRIKNYKEFEKLLWETKKEAQKDLDFTQITMRDRPKIGRPSKTN